MVVGVLFLTIIGGSITITAFQRGKEPWQYIAYEYSLIIINSVLSGFLLGYYFHIYRFLRASELLQTSNTKQTSGLESTTDLELSVNKSISVE